MGIACSKDSAPHDLVSQVPLGSKLSELDEYMRRSPNSRSEVHGFSHVKVGAEGLAEQGTIRAKNLGSYEDWKASPAERDLFTGSITFYHHGLTCSDVNEVVYENGRLVERGWGFLPG